MPFINTTVTCRIDDSKRETLKTLLGEAIALIPGKSEKFLMLAFSDSTKMYFSGNDSSDTAFIEVKVFGTVKKEDYDALTARLTEIYNSVLSIPKDRIYIKYEECFNWGWNGANF